MTRRHTRINDAPTPEYGWEEIARITQTGIEITIDIPTEYSKIGFLIVGGGASGSNESGTANCPGNGGNGGQVLQITNNVSTYICAIFVGNGGSANTPGTNKKGQPGQASYVKYNGLTYTANGGNTPSFGHTNPRNEKQENSGRGGHYSFGAHDVFRVLTRLTDDNYRETDELSTDWNAGGYPCGQHGLYNQFDLNDNNRYGSGGGAGANSYNSDYRYVIYSGGDGAGDGGYGQNNNQTNRGQDATFYGCGGGGGAFSSAHTYGSGGAGYQGLVIVYGKR